MHPGIGRHWTDLLLGLLQQPVDERLVDDLVRVLVRVPVCLGGDALGVVGSRWSVHHILGALTSTDQQPHAGPIDGPHTPTPTYARARRSTASAAAAAGAAAAARGGPQPPPPGDRPRTHRHHRPPPAHASARAVARLARCRRWHRGSGAGGAWWSVLLSCCVLDAWMCI